MALLATTAAGILRHGAERHIVRTALSPPVAPTQAPATGMRPEYAPACLGSVTVSGNAKRRRNVLWLSPSGGRRRSMTTGGHDRSDSLAMIRGGRVDRTLVEQPGSRPPSNRIRTRWWAGPSQDKLVLIAFGCAVFLLFGIVSDRTSVSYGRSGRSSSMTDAAGYNMAATFSGIVAITGLAIALWTRPRLVLPILGAAVAIAAFGLSVFASGIYWLGRLQGEVYFYGTGNFLEKGGRGTVHPAVGPPFFATAAVIGALATLALMIMWLWQAKRR